MRTNIARIFNTYGPRMALKDGRVVPAFLDQALQGQPLTIFGDGTQTRSFCYVSDMVDGLVRLASSEERFPVNLGNPVELTILEFAERIRELMGSNLPIVHEPLPVRRSEEAPPRHHQGQTRPGMGAEGGSRRRPARNRRLLQGAGACVIHTFVAAGRPSCTDFPPTFSVSVSS